jgi:hypothetical protein
MTNSLGSADSPVLSKLEYSKQWKVSVVVIILYMYILQQLEKNIVFG